MATNDESIALIGGVLSSVGPQGQLAAAILNIGWGAWKAHAAAKGLKVDEMTDEEIIVEAKKLAAPLRTPEELLEIGRQLEREER